MISFSDLWEMSEKINQGKELSSVFNELSMLFELYKKVPEITEETKKEIVLAKSRLLGEILLALTAISAKEDINVYEALMSAYQARNIKLLSEKYQQ